MSLLLRNNSNLLSNKKSLRLSAGFFFETMLKRLILPIALLLFANSSLANTDRNAQLQKIFEQAITAFNNGDYQLATKYFRKMLKNNPGLLRPRLELARALYKNGSTYLKATIGKHYSLSKSAIITPKIGIHHLIYADKKLYDGKNFGLKYFKPISRADYLNLTYSHKQLDYIDSFKSSSGVQNEFSIGYIKLPSISSRFDASLTLLRSNVQDKSEAFERLSLNLSYNQDIINAWNIRVNFKTNRTHYQAGALFDNGVSKKDKQKVIEMSLLNRLWQINNIAPKLTIGQAKNSSNIDVYGKSEPYVKLGFSQQF